MAAPHPLLAQFSQAATAAEAVPTDPYDPSYWAYQQRVSQPELRSLIAKLADAYHNGEEEVSDQIYDRLVNVYTSRFGPYTIVGAPPKENKERLRYYLSSLDKVQTEKEWGKYLGLCEGEWQTRHPVGKTPMELAVMDKLDGITVLFESFQVHTPKGLVRKYELHTRGNGVEGKNISHAIGDLIRVPLPPFDVTIRGEAVMSRRNFAKYAKSSDHPEGYTNARSLVASALNTQQSYRPELVREIDVLAYRILDEQGDARKPTDQLWTLQQMGWSIPRCRLAAATTTFAQMDTTLLEGRTSGEYEQDGLVVYLNQPLTYPEGLPLFVQAFKSNTYAEVYETTVRSIEWAATKDRRLIPTLIYDPVYVLSEGGGRVTLQRALADNGRWVGENGVGQGARITVKRSGDVIPRPVAVLKSVEPEWPSREEFGNYDWDANEVHLVLAEDSQEVVIRRLEHFFRVLRVEQVGPGRVRAMVEAGYDTIPKVIQLTIEQLAALDRMGPILAEKIVGNISTGLAHASAAQLMAASGKFGLGFGVDRMELITSAYPGITSMVNDPELISKLQSIKGLKKLALQFADHLPAYLEFLRECPQLMAPRSSTKAAPLLAVGSTGLQVSSVVTRAQTLAGLAVTPSGIRNSRFENEIYSKGGIYEPSITKSRTKLLVVKDAGELNNAKVKKAGEWGIPVMMFAEFKAKYGIEYEI